jgi:hypothetical protein
MVLKPIVDLLCHSISNHLVTFQMPTSKGDKGILRLESPILGVIELEKKNYK